MQNKKGLELISSTSSLSEYFQKLLLLIVSICWISSCDIFENVHSLSCCYSLWRHRFGSSWFHEFEIKKYISQEDKWLLNLWIRWYILINYRFVAKVAFFNLGFFRVQFSPIFTKVNSSFMVWSSRTNAGILLRCYMQTL